MSDMTAEERWKHLAELEKTDRFQELSLQGKDALIFYIMRLEAEAAQARAEEREVVLQMIAHAAAIPQGTRDRLSAAIRARSTD